MWYLILTARSLLWMLTSLIALLLMLAALISPAWLVADPKTVTYYNETIAYVPSVGVYAKCGKPLKHEFSKSGSCTTIAVRGLATESEVFPDLWKASVVFIAVGLVIMSLTVCSGVLSCCFQSIFRKSIFTMSGATQAFAGIWYIIGIMLYPMGWGADRVERLCGRNASPFYPDNCGIGTGLWMAIAGTALTFLAACLSVPAEKSTSSDKVQDQIYEGQTLICLP